MCVTEDMQKLASDLYKDAEAYRPGQPELADKMILEADDIVRQFGSLDCPPEKPKIDVVEDDDPEMDHILQLMHQANKPPLYVPPSQRLIDTLFGR